MPRLARRGREPDQIQVDTPQQDSLVSGRNRAQAFLFVIGGNERIDRIAHHSRSSPRVWEEVSVSEKPNDCSPAARSKSWRRPFSKSLVRRARVDPLTDFGDGAVGKLLS